jgi:hypothetical protein
MQSYQTGKPNFLDFADPLKVISIHEPLKCVIFKDPFTVYTRVQAEVLSDLLN